MIGRKLVLALLLSLVLVGGVASAAYVHSTVAQYSVVKPCFQLKGVPGLLQKAHFITTGGCTLNGLVCANPGNACTIDNVPSGFGNGGVCRPIIGGCGCGPAPLPQ